MGIVSLIRTGDYTASPEPEPDPPGEIDHPAEALSLIAGFSNTDYTTERQFDAIDENGWSDRVVGTSGGVNATLAVGQDPVTGRNCGIITFPVGYSGNGTTSALAWADAPDWEDRAGGDWVYLRYRMMYDAHWYGQDGSAVNKHFYFGHPVLTTARGSGSGILTLRTSLQGGEAFNGDYNQAGNLVTVTAQQAEVRRGDWTDIAVLAELGTLGTGHLHAWVKHPEDEDAEWVKTHDFPNRSTLANDGGLNASISFFSWRPIYGGQAGTDVPVEQAQYMDFIHIRAGSL